MRGIVVNNTKKLWIVIMGILVLCACGRKTLQKSDLETVQDLYSYSVGYEVGRNLQEQETQFNLEALFQGIEDVLLENQPLLDQTERQQAMFGEPTSTARTMRASGYL